MIIQRDALQEIDKLIAQAQAQARPLTIAPKSPAPVPGGSFGPFSSASAPPRNPSAALGPQEVQRPPLPGPSSSTKRPAQSISDERISKRPKHYALPATGASENANSLPTAAPSQRTRCPACGSQPSHRLFDCAVVKQGAVTMKKRIVQLEQENNPAHQHVLDQLRILYSNITNVAKLNAFS
jgi:hypothetical protein